MGRISFPVMAIAGFVSLLAAPISAATYDVFDDGSDLKLGSFEAPETGGLFTSASFTYLGALFSMLGADEAAPRYHADTKDISGASGGGFGYVFNSEAFVAESLGEMINCGIGQCAFFFETAFDDTPGSWYLEKLIGEGANFELGYYYVEPAAIPLPATGVMLLGAGAALSLLRRKGRSA